MHLRVNKRKKYFSRILISYLCLILVMLFFYSLILNYSDRQQIRQRTAANYSIFEEYCQITELEFSNISRQTAMLNTDYSHFLTWLDQPENISHQPFHNYKLAKYLNLFSSVNLQDLFLYNPHIDKVISANLGHLPAADYFSVYYQEDEAAILSDPPTVALDLVSLTLKQGVNTIAVRSGVNYNGFYPLVFVFDSQPVLKRIEQFQSSTGGELMILDTAGSSFISSPHMQNLDITGLELNTGIHYQDIAGQPCVTFAQGSRLTSGTFLAIIPLTAITQSLRTYRVFTIVSILLFSVLGMFLALGLTQYNYQPIARLTKSISQLNNAERVPHGEEFSYFESSIQNAIREKNQLSSRVAKFQKSQQVRLIHNLLNGYIPLNSNIAAIAGELGFTPLSSCFCVALFTIEQWDESHFPKDTEDERPFLSNIIIPNVVEELCNEKNRGYVINTRSSSFACLINLAPETQISHLKQIGNRTLEFLSQEMGILCTCGIGTICNSLKGIHQSYQEALRAQEYKILSGLGVVFCYPELSEASPSYLSEGNSRIQTLLLNAILNREENCSKLFDQIYGLTFSCNEPISPDIARNFILNLCLQVNTVLKELDSRSSVSLTEYSFSLDNDSYKTLTDFREYFTLQMERVRQAYMENHSVTTLGQSIQKYIEQNFSDPLLDVNRIGSYFDLSPAYCSKIFKQDTNQSLLESIAQLRIQKASDLLLNTNLTLDGIAEQCGFTSSTIFIRNFKKYNGVTPGNYRKLMKQL